MAKKDKQQKQDELDTQTTIVDMNVEGFKWYDPSKKQKNKTVRQKISRKEYFQMVKGAFAAFAPYCIILLIALLITFLLIKLWLS